MLSMVFTEFNSASSFNSISFKTSVVFPTRPEEEVMVQALPVGEEGERLLDLAARGRAGRQRWAVALPPKDMPIDWAADDDVRWGDLRRGIALGTVPVASVEIQVR